MRIACTNTVPHFGAWRAYLNGALKQSHLIGE